MNGSSRPESLPGCYTRSPLPPSAGRRDAPVAVPAGSMPGPIHPDQLSLCLLSLLPVVNGRPEPDDRGRQEAKHELEEEQREDRRGIHDARGQVPGLHTAVPRP